MCAINGFTFADQDLIRRMNQTLVYRGPDDGGEYVAPGISLGSRRLSILDLSSKARMPMVTPDKRFALVLNGEIYNHKDLRHQLTAKGYRFRTSSDTEVVLYGMAEYGPSYVSKLQGMFALAMWDNKAQTLVLARDRIGMKPLYYAVNNHQLIFSSEIKAILLHQVDTLISKEALNLYFRVNYIPSPLTIFEAINKLPPSTMLTFDDGRVTLNQYWQPEAATCSVDIQAVIPKLKETFSRSVASHLISDRPVGVFLSGGLDSSLVLAYTRKHLTGPINTYTVGFQSDQSFDKYNQDLLSARHISRYFGTTHHEIIVAPSDLIQHFDRIVYHLDEPINNHTQIANFMMNRTASLDIKVALVGDGGDELFAGYNRYQHLYFLRLYQYLPSFLRQYIPSLIRLYSNPLSILADKANILDAATIQSFLMSQPEDVMAKLMRSDLNEPGLGVKFFRRHLHGRVITDINRFALTDLSTWLPEESLIKSDKLSMAHGLEQRMPFLDQQVVQLALSIPFYQQTNGFVTKQIIRRLGEGILPPDVLKAPKWGFFSPMSKWLRTDLKEYVTDTLSSDHVDSYVDMKFVRKLMSRHCAGEYFPDLIWSVVTFARWHQQFIENRGQATEGK